MDIAIAHNFQIILVTAMDMKEKLIIVRGMRKCKLKALGEETVIISALDSIKIESASTITTTQGIDVIIVVVVIEGIGTLDIMISILMMMMITREGGEGEGRGEAEAEEIAIEKATEGKDKSVVAMKGQREGMSNYHQEAIIGQVEIMVIADEINKER